MGERLNLSLNDKDKYKLDKVRRALEALSPGKRLSYIEVVRVALLMIEQTHCNKSSSQ